MARPASAFVAKIARDLTSGWGRLAILGLILGAGVFILTLVADSTSVLLREMSRNYEETSPASATLELAASLKEGSLELLRAQRGIEEAQASQSLRLRVLDARGHWQPLLIFVTKDLTATCIAKVKPVEGPWPPFQGGIAWERTALPTFGWKAGDRLQLRTEDGRVITTDLLSVVHDPAVAPAYQERTAYAYAEPGTIAAWGLLDFDQIKIRADQGFDTAGIRRLADVLAGKLAKTGQAVQEVQVPPAHRHPHQGILSTILMVLAVFGLLSIVLSSLLAANAAASFLAREKRSIGILKTLGLPGAAIQVLVLTPLASTGIIATLIGLPLGSIASPSLIRAVANLLNFSIASPTPAFWAWLLPLLLGLLVPVALGLPLALRTQNLPILAALDDKGTEKTSFAGTKRISALGQRLPVLDMALRNAWRKKKRLLLSLLLMGMGGGLFLTATNLTLSWKTSLRESLTARRFDYQLRLGRQPSSGDLALLRAALPGLDRLELWPSLPVTSVSPVGLAVDITYPDEAHGSFRAYGVPNDTAMLRFPLMEGAWTHTAGEVVLNQSARARFPKIEIGQSIRLSLGGVIRDYRLKGVVKELGQAAAYLDPAEWESFVPSEKASSELVLAFTGKSDQAAVQASLTAWTEERSLPLEVLISSQEYRVGGTEHFSLLITLILLMGLITGAVGWLGVSSMLSLAVIERRTEFGILRSLGATPGTLVGSLLAEASAMLVLGFAASMLISIPLSGSLGDFFGRLSSQTPLPIAVNLPMAVLWLGLCLAGGLGASLIPALAATRQAVQETFQP